MALVDSQTNGSVIEATLRFKGTLGGTAAVGDSMGHNGTSWVRALGTAGSVVHGMAVALEAGVSGKEIQMARGAVIDGRFAGATPGAVLYVAEGSDNGKFTETLPTTINDVTTPVGFSVTATKAIIWPESGARTLDPS